MAKSNATRDAILMILRKLFESWAEDAYYKEELGLQVVSSPGECCTSRGT